MEEIAISKFKATCLSVLEKVRTTGRPIRVMKFGKPIAEVVPAKVERTQREWLGSLAGTAEIRGDLVGAAVDESAWEATGQ